MKKKTKIILAILAVVLVFCLWYTRPRSFEELAGDGHITSVSISAGIAGNRNGKAYTHAWIVDSNEGRDYVNSGIEDILKSCKYRVSLRSLLPFPSSYSISGKNDILFITIMADMEDGSSFCGSYYGATARLEFDKTVMVQATDKDISEKLLAYAQEFGW
ncbi:MAG: hypothetical protein HDT20_05815 [Oscillibacter sp.]|nr:hypothetical protein [Oscillibacter sp.]